MKSPNSIATALIVLTCLSAHTSSLDAADDVSKVLREFSPRVLSDAERKEAATMVNRDLRRRRNAANARNRAEWKAIKNRKDWEAYRNVRLQRLRTSLGRLMATGKKPERLNVKVTGTVKGDGFRIENVLYESRPGDWVPGNLYIPAKPRKLMPGILITHAHHRPKHQSELQDMGMTWARAGCLVLVIDQVGYGERRAHPFNGKRDYAKDYRWWRQDYYYRYDSGVQLQLAGESLMGWMVWDQMRGVDLLLARKCDPDRLIILGAVAGGGDPCGVTAALEPRIDAAVPFNFGGPQPETRYPLRDDAETSFNYLMGSYWESTRGLRRTAAGGFFHWVIVAGIAPRRLIHGHEFSWDGKRDPVWKRYQRIYGEFYKKPDHLAVAHGKGLLKLRPPQASHCTNIGRYHRRMIHPVFKRWFDINVTSDDEYSSPRTLTELTCLTPKAQRELKPSGLVKLVSQAGRQRVAEARKRLAKMSPAERRKQLQADWAKLLGEINPATTPKVRSNRKEIIAGAKIERILLEVEPEVVVPLLLLSPAKHAKPAPVVVGLAQGGKAGFLKNRSNLIVELLRGGAIICLPDVRGTGETRAGTSRGRASGDGNRSVNMLMFNQTMLGQRLRDLRSLLGYLRKRKDVDATKISLWGDSFAAMNPANTDFKVPRGVSMRPRQSEPMGGLLALFGALFDNKIRRVYVHGGLIGYQSVLSSPHVYIPHDVVVPDALTAGDLCDVVSALAPRSVRLDGLVDGLNRWVSTRGVRQTYLPAVESYRKGGAAAGLVIDGNASPAVWLLK